MSPQFRRRVDRVLVGSALLLGLVGSYVLVFHLLSDPLVDVHAYYEAAQRLNAASPLYDAQGDVNSPHFYFYPPLLALLFRPLALLPYDAAALAWEGLLVATFLLTVWRLGYRRRRTWIAIGILSAPIAWSLAVGQAQVTVTLLLALGNPAAVAFAAQLKVLPALVALYWVGRRDWTSLRRFIAWSAFFVVVQVVLEPGGSIAFLGRTNLGLVGQVNNMSPYAISPILWLVAATAGCAVTLRLAPTRLGWASAVTYSVLVTPRLLEYMLMTLLAALRGTAGSVRSDGASVHASASRQ